MQPFDALTTQAVIEELKAQLVPSKFERVVQLSADEILLSLRTRRSSVDLLLSAQAATGRLHLATKDKTRTQGKPGNFCLVLRKHLTSSTCIAIEQMPGERIVDLVFSCPDEFGQPKAKVLTVEIMGRHSNMVFWEKGNQKILGVSHVVTSEMSRARELQVGFNYVRPPVQAKPNLLLLSVNQVEKLLEENPALHEAISANEASAEVFESWLMSTFAGVGRQLAEEITQCVVGSQSSLVKLRETIERIRKSSGTYEPGMRADLTNYSVLSLSAKADLKDDQWISFPSCNSLVEEYYRQIAERNALQNLRNQLISKMKTETTKQASKLDQANAQIEVTKDFEQYKVFGDLILTHVQEIGPGDNLLECENLYAPDQATIVIPLNPNLSPTVNAQVYYKQFSKNRARNAKANQDRDQIVARLAYLKDSAVQIQDAQTYSDLLILQDEFTKPTLPSGPSTKSAKHRFLSLKTDDGSTIYVGRNRSENAELLNGVQPHDIWMHLSGQSSAHVILKVASASKKPTPAQLSQAAEACARFSKSASGKMRVMYTQCRHVHKIAGDKPGLVHYENEKTIEVDLTKPQAKFIAQAFAQ
jgi:predicted ribosome quality control (RQC) complex YloA/Tae2 family protein